MRDRVTRHKQLAVQLDAFVLSPIVRGRGLLERWSTRYVHFARGTVRVNGELLEGGDGAAITDAAEIRLDGMGSAEVLLFDLP